MSLEAAELFSTGVIIATAILILFGCIRLYRNKSHTMTLVYFTFTVVSLLLAQLYWLVYDFLRKDVQMPFAANEFAEAALVLLLSSMLRTVFTKQIRILSKTFAFSVLYAAANAVLWIAWNGDWIEALITGPAYAYFVVTAAIALKESDALKNWGYALIVGVASITTLMQAAELVFPETAFVLDPATYVLMLSMIVVWSVWIARAFQRKAEPRVLMSLSVGALCWVFYTMYSCSGWWYIAAELAQVAAFSSIFLAVRREVRA